MSSSGSRSSRRSRQNPNTQPQQIPAAPLAPLGRWNTDCKKCIPGRKLNFPQQDNERVIAQLRNLSWERIVPHLEGNFHERYVREFYSNLTMGSENNDPHSPFLSSYVNGHQIVLNRRNIATFLNIPDSGECIYFVSSKKELDENHIKYTTDLNDIESVHMSIVFVNKSFVRNCFRLLDRFVLEEEHSSMWNTAIWYENDESDFVENIYNIEIEHLVFFGPDEEGPIVMKDRAGKLLGPFMGSINLDCGEVPFTKNWDDIEEAVRPFLSNVVKELNTFALDFSKMDPVLMKYTIDLSYTLYNEVVPRIKKPSLIAIIEGCPGNCCQLTTISKLLWTIVNQRSFNPFRYSLYVSKSSNAESSSLVDCYHSELMSRYSCHHYSMFLSRSIFFIVIDRIEDFLLKEGDDPAVLLANFVSRFDRGSLIIATCARDITTAFSNHPNIEIQKRGPVQGTKCTVDTSQRPALFTVLNSQLKELVLEPEVLESDYDSESEESVNQMDAKTDDEMQMSGEEEKKKKFHLTEFDESEANTPKKPRASLGESVHRHLMSDSY